MASTTSILLSRIRDGEPIRLSEQSRLTLLLAAPAILSQLVLIAMNYIDAAMVGSLGANASAAIGLVSTSTWLLGEICPSLANGFAVQVAHRMGAGDTNACRTILRQGIVCTLGLSVLIGLLAIAIAPYLPHWLGGNPDICADASLYFFVFGLNIPLFAMTFLLSGMLRCAGNMVLPSLGSALVCVLNVVFNYLFIFVCGLGVLGAALGTTASMAVGLLILVIYVFTQEPFKSANSQIRRFLHKGDSPLYVKKQLWRPRLAVVRKAIHIGGPMAMEHIVLCSAQVCITLIVAPLGTIAIAANAFGIIIEGLCYMPGFGISDAATTLVGQSIGAGRPELRRSFSRLSVGLGVLFMSAMGALMYFGVPYLMPLMTPDPEVQRLTTTILRIEALAEPLYAASIVTYGVFVGTGDTLRPCLMNLGSIWVVRIPLAMRLSTIYGLRGVWIAMAIELSFRGLIFLQQLYIHNNEDNRISTIWRRKTAILRERLEAISRHDWRR